MLLVTGASGFVGTHLTKALDKLKIEWVGFDLVNGQDIRDRHQLDKIFELEQVTEVIHLAALAGVRRSRKYPREYISTNVEGTQNIVDMCEEHGVKKLISFSSSSVFGNAKMEERGYSEEDKKNPISLYGITKLAGEFIVNNSEVPSVIVRPFTIYGEEGRKDEVVYKWLEQIKAGKKITVFGDPDESSRGYVYVGDLVDAVVKMINGRIIFNRPNRDYNLGGCEVVTLEDILDIFKSEFNKLDITCLDRQKEDTKHNKANIDKAKRELGFVPKPQFKQNLRNIIKKFKKENL